ncbi:uncharacterized protein [Centroberyx affinis]|uniref:uncharacterized protein n=1 Tax=Centroberyx affinis TaxID=166261 RepID=UPI003A5BC164
MAFPPFLIVFIVLGINNRFQRVFRFICKYSCHANAPCKCHFCSTLVMLLFKGFFAGLVWVMIVYIDGNWYVCCSDSLPKELSHLPCKNKSHLTYEEQDTLFQLRDTSMDIGLMLMASAVVLVVVLTALMHCCTSLCSKSCGGTCSADPYRGVFKDHLLKETELMIEGSLRKAAAEYATAKTHANAMLKVLHTPSDATDATDAAPSGQNTAGKQEVNPQMVDHVRSLAWPHVSDFVFEIINDLPDRVKNDDPVMVQSASPSGV